MYAMTGIAGQVAGASADNPIAQHAPIRAIFREPARAEPWAKRTHLRSVPGLRPCLRSLLKKTQQ